MIVPNRAYTFDVFADLCEAHALTPVPGSGRWLPHPTEEGREIWGVMIKEIDTDDRKEDENGGK
jgi:hypothetical protein